MRKKPLILLVFLMMLYIGPMILAPSSYHTAIPTEQNMSKDFSLSTEYECEIYVATDGEGTPSETGDYTDTWIMDGSSMFALDGSAPYEAYIILEFDLPEVDFDTISLNFRGFFFLISGDPTLNELRVHNGSEWVDFGEIAEDVLDWTNITLDSNYVVTDTVYMQAYVTDDTSSTTVLIDYAEVVLCNFSYESAEEWYNKDWGFRKMISLEGASGAGTNYQVNVDVAFVAGMQVDFDDIRFTDNNGVTYLDCWRETYTASNTASFWVEVKDNLDTDQMIYMYFGNDGASTTSDGVSTFLFFDDFELNDLSRWTTSENQWSTSVTQKKYGSYSAFGDSAGTERQLVKTQEINYGVMFHSWSYHEDSVSSGANCYIFSSSGGFIGYTDANDFVYNNGTTYPYESDFITTGTWYEYEVGWSTTGQGTFYRDGVEKDTLTILASSPISNIRAMVDTSENIDFYIDDYYMRKWVYVEPIVIVGERIEPVPPPAWQDGGNAELLFVVAVDTVGLDMLLILGGLILIPCSTLYLVKGRGSEMSSDKFFFFCIAFVMGWALFLGGIM